ncbi:hypothetical protein ACOSP7_014787 [Xanthoceras sorbifolium]
MVFRLPSFRISGSLYSTDLYKLVLDSFLQGSFPVELNQTLITLIPKIPSPMDMSSFRPISLCNTSYKVISKIIVSRLKGLLTDLIRPNQVAFVPGRHIHDNIVVAQKILYKFRFAKSKKCFVAWKINLAKAYDKLQWDFIEKFLLEVGLCSNLITLIMFCVKSVSYRVVLNGEISNSFAPGCRIRQGDPISPSLSVCALYEEIFSPYC